MSDDVSMSAEDSLQVANRALGKANDLEEAYTLRVLTTFSTKELKRSGFSQEVKLESLRRFLYSLFDMI